jgi:hypothetical protein
MRNREEILKELSDLDRQESDLQAEIQDKERELAEAKASNKNLLKRYIGSSKKPVSLSVQAQKLTTLEAEIAQLKDMGPLIGERRQELKCELHLVDSAGELTKYRQVSEVWFEKINQAIGILTDVCDRGAELATLVQDLRDQNPISALKILFSGIDSMGQLDELGFDGVDRYRFTTEVVGLEKQLNVLNRAARSFSDLAFGLENISLRNLKWPPDKKTHRIEKDHQADPKGRFADDNWQARQLNRNQAAM